MRRCLLLLFFPLCAFAADAPPARHDHYNPALLNESALRSHAQGDTGTALLLLERAHLLAPHDARIARNLALLRAYREGRPLPTETKERAVAGDCCDDAFAPPPIWSR